MLAPVVFSILAAAGVSLAQTSTGTVADATSTAVSSPSDEPCAQISALVASYFSANPSATANPRLPYDTARACGLSVPVDETDAFRLLNVLMAVLEFQSDLEFKASPPPGYLLAPVDMMGDLQSLRDSVQSGDITSELDLETRISTIIGQAHDGHLNLRLDGLTVFRSQRDFGSLVSVSMDGKRAPKIYFYADLMNWLEGNSPEPSAISQVNDMDVSDFILQEQMNGTFAGFQDPDALYNAYLWTYNNGAPGVNNWNGLFFGYSLGDTGPTTSLTFENGSSIQQDNYAELFNNFANVTDGESFYQAFLNSTVKAELIAASRSSASMAATATATPAVTGAPDLAVAAATGTGTAEQPSLTQLNNYPSPLVISDDGTASGYFLDEPGFEDTAVLVLRAMSEDSPASFQSTVTEFLDRCRSTNKTHLVLDIQGNSGGTLSLGYDLLKQLFPTVEPYGAANYRAQEGFRLLGEAITPYSESILEQDPDNYTLFTTSDFAAGTWLNASGQSYTNFADYYGPVSAENDQGNYTNLFRTDFSSAAFNEAFGSIVVSGYANNTEIAPQPFSNENIIILTDGRCSSTCTTMAHFLKWQAKVKSIAVGGRPTNTGAMQYIGGIKGSQVYTLQALSNIIEVSYDEFNTTVTDAWNGTVVQTIYDDAYYLRLRTASAGSSASDMSFNFRNNIAEDDSSLTPLQFVYEAADCRMYYTPRHFLNITNLWADVAANAFGLNSTGVFDLCTDGSTNHPTSLSGNETLYDNGRLANVTVSTGSQSSESGQQNAGSRSFVSFGMGVLVTLLAVLVNV